MERGVLSRPILFFLDFPLVYDRTCAGVREREREREETKEQHNNVRNRTVQFVRAVDKMGSSIGRISFWVCPVYA